MPKQRDWISSSSSTSAGSVDPDAVYAFAIATSDPNDVYLRGGAVPPLFTAAQIRMASNHSEHERVAASPLHGAQAILHGEHDAYFHAPIRPGDYLTWAAAPHSVRQTPAGVVAVQRVAVSNEAGALVAEHFWSYVYVGAHTDDLYGPLAADHAFPEQARKQPLGSHLFTLARDQAFRYAGVSGDHVPHAVDGEAARDEGFAGRILQGLCTVSMCSGAVVKLAAGGDPSALRRFACRMSAPVSAESDLTVHVYDAGMSESGIRVIAFEATSAGVLVIRHGRAEFVQ